MNDLLTTRRDLLKCLGIGGASIVLPMSEITAPKLAEIIEPVISTGAIFVRGTKRKRG